MVLIQNQTKNALNQLEKVCIVSLIIWYIVFFICMHSIVID